MNASLGTQITQKLYAGINDLTRKRLLPEQVCDVVVPFFKHLRVKYPNTRFIVNSTILMSSTQLIGFITELDRYIQHRLQTLPFFTFLVHI